MDGKIIARYNDSILREAIQRCGIPRDQIKPLDAFESFIYEFERGGEGYILRVGHSFRKNEALIRGEVDWINAPARGGVSVRGRSPLHVGTWWGKCMHRQWIINPALPADARKGMMPVCSSSSLICPPLSPARF